MVQKPITQKWGMQGGGRNFLGALPFTDGLALAGMYLLMLLISCHCIYWGKWKNLPPSISDQFEAEVYAADITSSRFFYNPKSFELFLFCLLFWSINLHLVLHSARQLYSFIYLNLPTYTWAPDPGWFPMMLCPVSSVPRLMPVEGVGLYISHKHSHKNIKLFTCFLAVYFTLDFF